MIFDMQSKNLEIRAKKSNDLYFKTEGVFLNFLNSIELHMSSFLWQHDYAEYLFLVEPDVPGQ